MRKVIVGVVVLALLWCGWWAIASVSLRSGISGWLDQRSAEGWQAEAARVAGGGFPTRLVADVQDLALADPDTGLAVRTEQVVVSAPAWWPGRARVALDDGPISLASPYGMSQLQMEKGLLALDLRPGTALELEGMGWTSGPWRVTDAAGVVARANALQLEMVQVDGAVYDLVARAEAFAPGDAARRGLSVPEGFPDAFDSLQLEAQITFDRPWDRQALDDRRPQPRKIDLTLAEARWGALSLNLAADLVVDSAGTPEGSLALQAQNWQTMLDLAETTGVLPAGLRGQAESVLGALARASGNEATLDVELTLSGGMILLGFLPIAPAPRIVLR